MSLLQLHVCTKDCQFDLHKRCRLSGAFHVCSSDCLLRTKEGDVVCMWTGVCAGTDNVDRSVEANTPRRFSSDSSFFGADTNTGGFVKPAKRKHEIGPGVPNKDAKKSLTKARQGRARLPAVCPNTVLSRYRYAAETQIELLFFRNDIRKAVRGICRNKRNQMFRAALRCSKKELRSGGAVSLLDSVAEWKQCCEECPLLEDVHAGDAKPAIVKACVEFLMQAWSVLERTKYWQQGRKKPDFESFCMGIIYICRDGGMVVEGYPMIPRLRFFMDHTPNVNDLTHFHVFVQEKDCRASIIGRRRIMEGRNAINSAWATELSHQASSDLAIVPFPTVTQVLNQRIPRNIPESHADDQRPEI